MAKVPLGLCYFLCVFRQKRCVVRQEKSNGPHGVSIFKLGEAMKLTLMPTGSQVASFLAFL